MVRVRTQALGAVVLASLLVLLGLASTVGYVDQRQYTVALAGPSSVKCSARATITATIRAAKNGKPVANQSVSWSIDTRKSAADSLTKSKTMTNRQGKASVKLDFGNVAGKRVVQARIPGAKPKVTVRCSR